MANIFILDQELKSLKPLSFYSNKIITGVFFYDPLLLGEIFSYLPFENVLKFQLVCKLWQEALLQADLLWKTWYQSKYTIPLNSQNNSYRIAFLKFEQALPRLVPCYTLSKLDFTDNTYHHKHYIFKLGCKSASVNEKHFKLCMLRVMKKRNLELRIAKIGIVQYQEVMNFETFSVRFMANRLEPAEKYSVDCIYGGIAFRKLVLTELQEKQFPKQILNVSHMLHHIKNEDIVTAYKCEYYKGKMHMYHSYSSSFHGIIVKVIENKHKNYLVFDDDDEDDIEFNLFG